MGEVKHTVKHDLTQEQARQAIDTAMQVYCRKYPEYGGKTAWLNDYKAHTSFTIKGMTLVAKVEIKKDHIDMGMDVPLLLRPFRGKALSVIESEIRKWLARAKAGEIREVT